MKNLQDLKELYGKHYVDNFETNQSAIRLQNLIKYMNLDEDDRVADFACGNGMLMEHTAHKVKSYVGVDFSEPFIDAANRKKERLGMENAEFFCSAIDSFCQKNQETFDVGFAMDFSEHVYDEQWLEVLRNIRGSLKKHGRLYLHTPNGSFFLEIMKSHNFVMKQSPEHIAVRTTEQNVRILEEAGFSVRTLKLIPHYNVLRFIHPVSHIPLIGKYFEARIFIEATK